MAAREPIKRKQSGKLDADDTIAGNGPISRSSNVRRPDSVVRTGLVEGQIAILAESSRTRAVAPQILRLEPVDLDIKLAWERGMLVFRGEPLKSVLAEVGYTTMEFTLESEELPDVRVGGYFRAGDIEALMTTLHESFHIRAEHVADDHIVLRALDWP